MTAGHTSADQVPVKSAHSKMLWPKWVVLIAGSTGTALRAVRLPTVASHRALALCLRRERDGFVVAFVSGHHRPSHPGEFTGERDGGDLGRTPRQQRGKPGSMLRAVDLGIADHRKCASREQAAPNSDHPAC